MMWIVFLVLILLVLYSNTSDIAGWSKGDSFILTATIFFMQALSTALFFSLQEIPNQIRMGTMDFVVTKPVDSQFWVSTRRFNFDQIGPVLAAFAMIAIGVRSSGVHPDLFQWLTYSVLCCCALAVFYAFNLALMTTGIWLIRVDNLWVLGESVTQIARYPLDIYGNGVQKVLTYWVPLGLLATIPSRQLVKGLDPSMVLLGLVWAVGAVIASRCFWSYALKHYSSASS